MSLFIATPKRVLKINDAYFMALVFIMSFWVTRLTMKAFEKKKKITESHLGIRGGELDPAQIILSCIEDEKHYFVKDQALANLIAAIARENLRRNSLIISSQLVRYFAYKLAHENLGLMVKFKSAVLFSDNPIRFLTRLGYSTLFGIITALTGMISYGVFFAILTFATTENCGIPCERYFAELEPGDNGSILAYSEQPERNLIIAGNDQARQVQIWIPVKDETHQKIQTDESQIIRKYEKSKRKAKQVNFADFQKTDPTLRQFKNLEEPDVKQKSCPLGIENIQESIE